MSAEAKVPTPAVQVPEQKKEPSRTEVKAQIKELSEKLKKLDAKKNSGAASRLPKSRMLDASAIEAKNPDKHYLYVNSEDPGNLQTHLEDGYHAVGEQEAKDAGVRQRVGELVLMEVPREVFEERIEEQKDVAKSRLTAHKAEFKKEVEGVVRELKDRGYSDHEISRILVDE